jgi:hypothetical protein
MSSCWYLSLRRADYCGSLGSVLTCWIFLLDTYTLFLLRQSAKVMIIKYEDLKDPQNRTQALTALIKFLDLPVSKAASRSLRGVPDTESIDGIDLADIRINCAFGLADTPETHRQTPTSTAPSSPDNKKRDDLSTVSASQTSKYMVKDDLYDRATVCDMWAAFGSYAKQQGYQIFKGFDCNSTSRE